MKKNAIKRISFVAIFAAISILLYCYVKFPLPIFPSFLDINFSMIPILICAFMLGPWDATICVILRCLLKWILPPGTGTGYVGEIADVLNGLAVVIPAGLIYQKLNIKNKTILAFAVVIISWVVMAILANIFINIPWYTHLFFKGDMTPLIGMSNAAFKLISFGKVEATKETFMVCYIFLAVIPFNLLLSSIVVLFTAIIHKRLRVLYERI
ncbi:MAG: ECF transporter S component [Anaeroplasmataceae bacterium]|nr:ECF transporter S component [Anaeroplasmataceae bacterium]